jgi:hypothetical protein
MAAVSDSRRLMPMTREAQVSSGAVALPALKKS